MGQKNETPAIPGQNTRAPETPREYIALMRAIQLSVEQIEDAEAILADLRVTIRRAEESAD